MGAQALALCAAYKSCFFPLLEFSVITGAPSLRDTRNTLRMIQTCSQKHKTEAIQCKASFFCLVLCCIYDFHYNQESRIIHQACQVPWSQFLSAGSASASPELKAPGQHFSQFHASSSHQREVNDLLVMAWLCNCTSLPAAQMSFVRGFPIFLWLGSQVLNQLWSMIPHSSSGQQEISEVILKIISLMLQFLLVSSDGRL